MNIEKVKETGIFKLSYQKASYPATYKQCKYLLYLAENCEVSKSQLMKRLEMKDAHELISLGKENIKFKIIV